MGGTVLSTLVAVRIVCATAEFSGGVLEPWESLVYKRVWNVLLDISYAVRMVLYAFYEIVL